MKFAAFILNLPYTLVGMLLAISTILKKITLNRQYLAIIFSTNSVWWFTKNARALTIGHVVVLTKKQERNDLEHELIHVQQKIRQPFIQPLLYTIENLRHGYQNNKYEIEAYSKSNSRYYSK